MNVAEKIIHKFGGVRAMARALNAPPTTIQSWKKSGLIPAKKQETVLASAHSMQIDLSPADFFADEAA